jgi:hypothetical protein
MLRIRVVGKGGRTREPSGPTALIGCRTASFTRGSLSGFSARRVEKVSDGGNTALGQLCPGSFTVNAGSEVGPLFFPKGQYLIYIPAKSGISCRRGSVLFTRFLAAPCPTRGGC